MMRLIRRFKAFVAMERQNCSGLLRTATTLENKEAEKELICSPEDYPWTCVPPKDIAE